MPRSWRGASQGHQAAPLAFLGATRQALWTYVHPVAQHSFLPAFIFLSNKHCWPDKQPANTHLGSTGPHLAIHQRFGMQPPPPGPRLCSPVLHARLQLPLAISNLFLPVKHWAEKWPHPSALTPTKDPKRPGSPATPACRSHSPSASRHTHGLSRNSPALARCPTSSTASC